MAERKVLNLDALIPDQQYVKLDGVEHEIQAPTVEMYMKVMKSRQRMKNADSDVESMEQAVMLITLACPTIPEERLSKLPLPALTALADLIQQQMEGTGDENTDGTSDGVPTTGE